MTEKNITEDSSSVKRQRWVNPEETPLDTPETFASEHATSNELRPLRFDDYPGQDKVKDNIRLAVRASKILLQKSPDAALDHVLLHGPPGLGKTTLANIIANELGTPFYRTSGPVLVKSGDLAGILASLEPRSVLFIDEIHRIPPVVEEVLYTAMEDFRIEILIGEGTTARTVAMPVPKFTLVAATTRVSMLSPPLVTRFGIVERLDYYDENALIEIILRNASILNLNLDRTAALELAKRCRGTPRIANRLIRRVRDFAIVENSGFATKEIVDVALQRLGVDREGLDDMDRKILSVVHDIYSGGPVGLNTLAATVGEDRSTIEEFYEPFLVHRGFLARSSQGRMLTEKGSLHLKT